MKPVNYGIDLGTTNSLIAKYKDGKIEIFKNPVGHKDSMASVVAFRKERTLIGDKAREYLLKDPVNVFANFKRRMGTDDKFYVVNLDDNIVPIELSAYVLRELQQFVHSGEKVEAAVITIPASFDTMQSNATKKAGELAGLQEIYLLQEPIAASLAYFNGKEEDINGYWLVYDLGGGTFDIALVEIKDGEMKVKDHEGNNFLGGADFDRMIVDQLIVPEIVSKTGFTNFDELLTEKYGKYEKLFYLLLYKAEELKKELSAHNEAEIDFSANIEGIDYDFCISFTVEQFNTIIANSINDTIQMLGSILKRNDLQPIDIQEIILVGGSTFIPYVREQLYQQTSIHVNASIDPTTAIVAGAAFYAANKYYKPIEEEPAIDLTSLISENEAESTGTPVKLDIAYSKMSKEDEEVLLIKLTGEYEQLDMNYRIVRNDGGFDTGLVKAKAKYTEFLPLLPGVTNNFSLRFYNMDGTEVTSLKRDISISQGQYNISGQPLPKDISIEVDDKENGTTRLELIFQKNSILPLKKTLYREISKTVKKGSNDSIIINILEGDHCARALSNLTIACIEISGKDLNSDLLKGSDIEIQISISDSRELKTEVFLVMTQQEFKNVFTISEKNINIARLKEQFFILEKEVRSALRSFNQEEESIWAIQTEKLLESLLNHKTDLLKLKDNDHSDKKYVIAEAVFRISQEYDKIGGYDRLERIQSDYIRAKDIALSAIENASFNKESLTQHFNKITQAENQFLRSRNPSIISQVIKNLEDLSSEARWCTNSTIIYYYLQIKSYEKNDFTNYKSAEKIFVMADKAMEEGKYVELQHHVINLLHLMPYQNSHIPQTEFKGTGIG